MGRLKEIKREDRLRLGDKPALPKRQAIFGIWGVPPWLPGMGAFIYDNRKEAVI
jgi:hypothetical protein